MTGRKRGRMRNVKGSFGYLARKKKTVILRTILYFGISLAIFIAGYLTTGTRKNLLTVVAVLGCLPACKSAVNMIMLLRAAGCSKEAYDRIDPCEGRLIGMYDMYFTSYQQNFPISHMVVDGKVILAYHETPKFDEQAAVSHLQTMLKQGGFKDYTVSVTGDLSKYCEQLTSRASTEPSGNTGKEDEARVLLYEISL